MAPKILDFINARDINGQIEIFIWIPYLQIFADTNRRSVSDEF